MSDPIKRFILAILFLMIIDSASAANIHGSIYDITLERINDARVDINTEPRQFLVAKDGSYDLDVPEGSYTIRAEYYDGRVLTLQTEENISVKEDGDYVLDLILFPVIEEEDELEINETDYEIESDVTENTTDGWSVLVIVLISFFVLLLLAALIVFLTSRMRKMKKKEKEIQSEERVIQKEIYDDSSKVLAVIRKEGGRTTQKEIRKHVPLSEAKISLLIAELEHKGTIEKIKKGRGNIIILKPKK